MGLNHFREVQIGVGIHFKECNENESEGFKFSQINELEIQKII